LGIINFCNTPFGSLWGSNKNCWNSSLLDKKRIPPLWWLLFDNGLFSWAAWCKPNNVFKPNGSFDGNAAIWLLFGLLEGGGISSTGTPPNHTAIISQFVLVLLYREVIVLSLSLSFVVVVLIGPSSISLSGGINDEAIAFVLQFVLCFRFISPEKEVKYHRNGKL